MVVRLLARSARPLLEALDAWLQHGLLPNTQDFFVHSGVCDPNPQRLAVSLFHVHDDFDPALNLQSIFLLNKHVLTLMTPKCIRYLFQGETPGLCMLTSLICPALYFHGPCSFVARYSDRRGGVAGGGCQFLAQRFPAAHV